MRTRQLTILIATIAFLSISALNAQQETLPAPEKEKHSVGLGLGIPYGVLGGNLDINIAPNFNVSAGLGTTVIAGVGYTVGVKYFFAPAEKKFRPRVLVFYGTNAAVELKRIMIFGSSSTETKTYNGLNLGAGALVTWGSDKSNGIDFDIIYMATTGLDIDELRREGFHIEEPGKVKISIGYRYLF